MNNKDIYKAEIIGGIHGLTCIFPRLRDIVDYEEQRRVPDQGYPRFIPHPFVVEVQEKHREDEYEVIAIQTPEAASFVHTNYFDSKTRDNSEVRTSEKKGNRYGLIYVRPLYIKTARESVTNAGVILNSRKAQRILENKSPEEMTDELPIQLSQLEKGSKPELTFLYTSGMAAILSTIDGCLKKGTGAMVIGNTYVDTRKIFQKLPERFSFKPTIFLNNKSQIDIPDSVSVVFLEIPTNPLLEVLDLKALVHQAHKKGAVVIVDSTIATPHHFSPFDFDVDVVIHSSSKALSGKNDHIGGVLFVNPHTPELAQQIVHLPFELDTDERIVLAENLKTFTDRIQKMEANAVKIVEYLRHNPHISKVHYPNGLKHGNGHVVSFKLQDDRYEVAETFYDNCTIPIKVRARVSGIPC